MVVMPRPTPPSGSQVDSDSAQYIRDQMTEMGGQIRAELNVQLKSAFTEVSSKFEQIMGSLNSRFNELDARMLKMESGTNPKTDRSDDMSSYKANNHGHGEGARPKPSQGAGNNGKDKVVFPVSMLTASGGKGPIVDRIPAKENESLLGTIGHVFLEGNIYIKSNLSLSQISNTLGVQKGDGQEDRSRIRDKGRGSSVPRPSFSEHEGSIDDRVASRNKSRGAKKHRSPSKSLRGKSGMIG